MKIKTSELTGAALDWAVEEAQGYGATFLKFWNLGGIKRFTHCQVMRNYWENWGVAGPIIERERINLDGRVGWAPGSKEFGPYFRAWQGADSQDPEGSEFGPTPLIAAMRCYVASRLGDEVDVPEELC